VSEPIKSLLSNNQDLRPLLNKAQFLSDLHRQFIAVAPNYFAQSSQILGLQLGTLSIAVANATLAAKLRQFAPELVILMQKNGCAVSGIRVKVQISFDRLQPKIAPHILSKTAQSALNDFSLSLGDSPLKLALKKLTQK
jgi:hypothetical protein